MYEGRGLLWLEEVRDGTRMRLPLVPSTSVQLQSVEHLLIPAALATKVIGARRIVRGACAAFALALLPGACVHAWTEPPPDLPFLDEALGAGPDRSPGARVLRVVLGFDEAGLSGAAVLARVEAFVHGPLPDVAQRLLACRLYFLAFSGFRPFQALGAGERPSVPPFDLPACRLAADDGSAGLCLMLDSHRRHVRAGESEDEAVRRRLAVSAEALATRDDGRELGCARYYAALLECPSLSCWRRDDYTPTPPERWRAVYEHLRAASRLGSLGATLRLAALLDFSPEPSADVPATALTPWPLLPRPSRLFTVRRDLARHFRAGDPGAALYFGFLQLAYPRPTHQHPITLSRYLCAPPGGRGGVPAARCERIDPDEPLPHAPPHAAQVCEAIAKHPAYARLFSHSFPYRETLARDYPCDG